MIELIKRQSKEIGMNNEWNNNENLNDENIGEQDYAFQTLNRNGRPKTLGWSVASLVLGVIAAVTCSLGWSSLILGAASIIFAAISRRTLGYFDGKALAGLILGIFGAVFGGVMIIYAFTLDDEDNKYLWDWIKQMFADMEAGGDGTEF